MKKLIIVLCIVVTIGFIFFIGQDEFREKETANSIDEIFSGQIFDDAKEKLTVHAMGLSPEEKVLTVRIEKTQYKDQAEEYFRDSLDSRDMESYELEVFVDDLTLHPLQQRDL
ncbi:hypothetical protein EYB33_19065 [Lysinibacillus sphaericus]|uniref:hypothetical protein n=1 Tax=Lysinibacillus sphaericus TaxID=1421 RepID=UPI001E5FA128|nr:hypothetical protein [Lysinibacillus sphaericus]UDK98241.1 hypothetical protein EYB33_19065 [Lysinibacillus sphaericus]